MTLWHRTKRSQGRLKTTRRLKLKVNEANSAVARPQERKFLGFSCFFDQRGYGRLRGSAIAAIGPIAGANEEEMA